MEHSQDNRFNLVDDPWIRCMMNGQEIADLSIRQVFARWTEVRRLAGELPTQDYAILRLLLAIAYSALRREGTPNVSATKRWVAHWMDAEKPVSLVELYLNEWGCRFDLFDSEAPFMQVADLRTSNDRTEGISRLIVDVPSGHQYFSTRAGSGLRSLSYAEAARWLIHVHAYDPSGIKSGAVGDPRVKGGKGYPIGTSWTGQTGGMYFEGKNLQETLLLNLDYTKLNGQKPGDLPVWERDAIGAAVQFDKANGPSGVVDCLTWPSRRVRMLASGGVVSAVLVSNGDPLAPQNQFNDPYTSLRHSKPQSAKFKHTVYMPKEHDPELPLWRGVGSVLALRNDETVQDNVKKFRPAAVTEWIARLVDEEILSASQTCTVRLVGAVYGTQNSVVSDIIDDALPVRIGLLAQRSKRLAVAAIETASQTESAARALGYFAGDLAEAAGGEAEAPRETTWQSAFFALEPLYRQWLAKLEPGKDPFEAREEWHSTARLYLNARARELVRHAGPAAVIGRWVSDSIFISAGTAERKFNAAVKKSLPLTTDTSQKRSEDEERTHYGQPAEAAR